MNPVSAHLSTYASIENSEVEGENSIVINSEEEELQKLIFSDSIVQLQLHQDRFIDLLTLLNSVINYIPCEYQLLYIKENELCYYTPKSYLGAYYYGKDVTEFIENKLHKIIEFYEETNVSEKWKVLKIANLFQLGLKKIITNYLLKNTYQSFVNGLEEIHLKLNSYIEEKIIELNSTLQKHLDLNLEPKNYFQLLNYYCYSYSKSILIEILKKDYGERLTEIIFKDCEDDIILYDNAYKIMFAIATLVTIEDVEWYYYQSYKKSRAFSELSYREINYLLNHFRLSPENLNFMEYFSIPLTHDKYMVDPIYFEINKAQNTFEQNLINEINVYCDLYSYVIWQPCEMIQISPLQIYDQLNKFFENPYNPHLFHTDRYINFLTIATTIFSYSSYCKNEEERRERFDIITEKIKHLIEKSNEIYPNDVEKYKFCWNSLLGQINKILKNPNYDMKPYYKSLITHPLEDDENKQQTLNYYSQLQPFEFLARRIAYWNRYYLESNLYLNDEKNLKDTNYIFQRIGTLIYLPNSKEILKVDKIIYRDGFICQIAISVKPESKYLDVYLLFQGTIENEHSKKRDYFFQGAGYELWKKEKGNLIFDELIPYLDELSRIDNKSFKIHLVGHSLGGSDAQNALSFFGEAFVSAAIEKELIIEINLHTFNSAGVPKDTIDRFNLNFKNFSDTIGELTHSIVKNDIVSKSNAGKIGLDFCKPEKIKLIEISNLGLYYILNNHCEFIYSCTNNILPHRLLNHENIKHSQLIQKYLCGAAYNWTNLGIHLQDIKDSNPYFRTAYSIAIFAICSSISAYLVPFSNVIGGSIGVFSAGGIGVLRSAGDHYTREQMKGAISQIQEAAYQKWYGTQILEGTG